MLATLRRRFTLAIMSLLFLIMFLPLSLLPNVVFAQTKPAPCPLNKLCSLTKTSSPNSGSSSVTLNPSEAPPSSKVTGVGSNWASGDSILVQWDDGTNLATTTVQSDGTFTVPFTVPSNATQGAHYVYFTDQNASYFIPATLTVGTCSSSSVTVQSVYTTDSNFNSTTVFAQGAAINYVVLVNNSCGGTINANFHFQDFWGTINDLPLEIFDKIYQNVTLPMGASGWYVSTTVPKKALPGSFTDEVNIADMNNIQDNSTKTSSFTVTGNVQVKRNGNPVPYYTQFWTQNASYREDCGPTSVAMVLAFYQIGPGGTTAQQIEAVRTVIKNHDGNATGSTIGKELEYALHHYGSSYSEISQYISGLANPAAQLTDIAAAIKLNQPVIVFINAIVLGRKYSGHWLVVRGFFNDGTNTYVLVNDPDSDFLGGKPSQILLSTFGNAIQGGRGLEPNNIAGIIVKS